MNSSNQKILTISIAAYNVEKYIKKALDSLVDYEILSKIEVIVVNDGSTDDTLKIIKEYEIKYPNIFIIIDKSNAGYGSTVNTSIKLASGKYYKLLDGDDWYDTDSLTRLVNELEDTDVDMVLNTFNKVINGKTVNGIRFQDKYFGSEVIISSLDINEGIPMHCVTYKTSVLKESGVVLKENRLYTDNYYVSIPLTKVRAVKFLKFPVYNYRLGLEGQTMNRNVNIKHIDDLKEISLDLVNFFKSVNKNNECYNYLCTRIAATCVDYFAAMLTLPICNETLDGIKNFDNIIKNESQILYERMASLDRKASNTVNMIRKSKYCLYWFFATLRKFI